MNSITNMGKLGNYEYPLIGINEAVAILKLIHREKIRDIKVLARKLGHTTHKSGRFRAKLSALKQYGLIIGKSGNLNISPLGEDIIKSLTEEEEVENICKAVSKIKLFTDLYSEIGDETKRDTIKKGLKKITGVEIKEWILNEFIKPYKEALPFLREIKKKEYRLMGYLDIINLGRVDIIDKATFEIALRYMDLLGQRLGVGTGLRVVEKILLTLLTPKEISKLEKEINLPYHDLALFILILEKAGYVSGKAIDSKHKIYELTPKGKDLLLSVLQNRQII